MAAEQIIRTLFFLYISRDEIQMKTKLFIDFIDQIVPKQVIQDKISNCAVKYGTKQAANSANLIVINSRRWKRPKSTVWIFKKCVVDSHQGGEGYDKILKKLNIPKSSVRGITKKFATGDMFTVKRGAVESGFYQR